MKGFQPKLCTAGGFVLGTAALHVLLDGSTSKPIKKELLRGAKGEVTELQNESPTKREASDLVSRSGNGTSRDAEAETDPPVAPGEDPEYSKWTQNRSDVPSETSLARSAGAQPAREHRAPASGAVSRRTNLFSPGGGEAEFEAGFRLKLYWREGYLWQESPEETYWCMKCGSKGVCEEDEVIMLGDCETERESDTRFEVIKQKKGDQYQVVGTDLCLQRISGSRIIALKECRADDRLQLFKRYRGKDGSFDLRPRTRKRNCLTNHHHPRPREVIYAEKCTTAHRTKTGYWVKW